MRLLYVHLAFLLPKIQEDTAIVRERHVLTSRCGWAISETAKSTKLCLHSINTIEYNFIILLTQDQETAYEMCHEMIT